MKNPILSPVLAEEDSSENKLRPQLLADFVGQAGIKDNLSIFLKSAKNRGEALDHVLLHGPPGLGKTSISHIISRELGVGFKATSGPVLSKAGDLAAILTNLDARDVLFIDEIHRLNPAVEEILYPAMEDYRIDIIIGTGPSARTIQIDLPKFTLVGATTRIGLLSNPLRDRFGIPLRLEFYQINELKHIIIRGAAILQIGIDDDGAEEIAARARGTPRIAVRLLRRIRDFCEYYGKNVIDKKIASEGLTRLEVDNRGLDSADRRYLRLIAEHYDGGPVGIDTIAAALSEDRDSLEDTIEPYLLQCGFIARTPRGRMLTMSAYQHLGLGMPQKDKSLFEE